MSKELQNVNPTGLIAITDGKIVPANLDQLWRLSTVILDSGLAPKGMDKVEKLVVAAIMGMDVGLSYMQSIQNIATINGRPSIWGDAMLGLVQGSGTLEAFSETFEGVYPEPSFTAICVARRKGRGEYRNEFSIQDAKDAQLLTKGGPWTQYKKRMLKMRARAFTLRDGWSDVLKGLYMAEEAADTPPIEVTSTYPQIEEQVYPGNKPVYNVQSHDTLSGVDIDGHDPIPAVTPQAPAEPMHDDSVKFHQPDKTPEAAPAAPEAHEPVKNHHGFSVGDLAYYKMGQGLGWKQVKIESFSGDQALIRINESFDYNGKPMMGVAAKKPLDTLRAHIPQPLGRNDFINLRTGFTKEYLESIKDRIEETRDPKVIADLIFKAKKFFGDDFKVPGILQVPDEPGPNEPEIDEPGADDEEMNAPPVDEPEEPTPPVDGGTVWLCDLADQTALKTIKGMIEERGMDRTGVKLAMRGFVLHLKGEAPVKPFDTDDIGHIENRYAKHFGEMLDSLRPAHEVSLMINHYGNRINGFGEYVKSKLLLFPTPIEVDHWYLLSPGAINKIKLNIDEWAKELLQFSEGSKEKF